ncbi:MAG: nuclear transport factor 2 family protein [Planctomycetes bacterium]|nr:nuclear transport factor 2 family protein [Planctomycetota bacterium]MCB9934348.1 nuclear transport factor 2 family protein [Planctomycetota bacterium]
MSLSRDSLQRFLDVHNAAVETGDFAAIVRMFAPDGELRYVGIDFGPFAGHEAIARSFRERPPLHKLVLSSVTADGDKATAVYATADQPEQRAGTLVVTTGGNLTQRLTISVINRSTDG